MVVCTGVGSNLERVALVLSDLQGKVIVRQDTYRVCVIKQFEMRSMSRFNRHRFLSGDCYLVSSLVQLRLLLFVLFLQLLQFLLQLLK